MKIKTISFFVCVVGFICVMRPFKAADSAPHPIPRTTIRVNDVSAPSIVMAAGTPLTLTVETNDPAADCTVTKANNKHTITETIGSGTAPLTIPIDTAATQFRVWIARCTHTDTVSMDIVHTRICAETEDAIPPTNEVWEETRISVSGAQDPCQMIEIVPGNIAADTIYWVHIPTMGVQLINPCIAHYQRAGAGNILMHTWRSGRNSFCYDAIEGGIRQLFQDDCDPQRNEMGFLAEPRQYNDGCIAPCDAVAPDGRYCVYPCPPIDKTAEKLTYAPTCQLPDEWEGQCPPITDFAGNIVADNPSLCALYRFNEDQPNGFNAEQALRNYIRSIPHAIWLIGNETDWIWQAGLVETVEFNTGETAKVGGSDAYAKFYADMYDMIKTEYDALPEVWKPRLVFCQASKAGSNGENDVEGLNYCRDAYKALPDALAAVNPAYVNMDAAETIYALSVHQYFPTFNTNDGTLLTAESLIPTVEREWIGALQQFETWAVDAGLGDKPLWLTEFGALRAWCPEALLLQAVETGEPCVELGADNVFYGRNNTEGLWGLQQQQIAYLRNHEQWKMAWWFVAYNDGGTKCQHSGGIWGFRDVTSTKPYHFDCQHNTFYVYDEDKDGTADTFRMITVDVDQDGELDPIIDSNHDGVIDRAADTIIDADGDGQIDLTILDRGTEYNLDANYVDGRPDVVYYGVNRVGHTLRCVLMHDTLCARFEPDPLVTFMFDHTLFLPFVAR